MARTSEYITTVTVTYIFLAVFGRVPGKLQVMEVDLQVVRQSPQRVQVIPGFCFAMSSGVRASYLHTDEQRMQEVHESSILILKGLMFFR